MLLVLVKALKKEKGEREKQGGKRESQKENIALYLVLTTQNLPSSPSLMANSLLS